MITTTALPASRIVSVDIPDPDNFLMVLRVLNDFVRDSVAVILSPRPVTFKAAPYGEKLTPLLEAINKASANEKSYSSFPVGLHRLISPVTNKDLGDSEWVRRLEPKDQVWLYQDPDFSDETVREDSYLYLTVSALRLVGFLDAHGVDRNRYNIYWDKNSLRKITVGLRHAFHLPDFTFDFNGLQLCRYENVITSNIDDDGNVKHVLSDNLRKGITEICEDYIREKTESLSLDENTLLRKLEDLIATNIDAGIVPEIYVGGPFTETLAYLNNAPVKRIVGMGGFIHGSSNLFPNQFNFLVDMESAKTLLKLADSGKVELILLPTECVKDSVYTLNHQELEECMSESPESLKLYSNWSRIKDPTKATYTPFDLVAAMTVNAPDLYTSKKVKLDVKTHLDGSEVIMFRPCKDGEITMYWNDNEYMKHKRSQYLDALKNTFRISS